METRDYNSKLRALLSIRDFHIAFEKHYEQLKKIEEEFDRLNTNALSIIETNCKSDGVEKWKVCQKDVRDSIESINYVLSLLQKKIEGKERNDSKELWKQFDIYENKLKKAYRFSEKLGYDILPENAHKHWEKDVCNFEEIVMPLIVSHADACKLELEMIEKYTPKELDEISQVITKLIPDDFTFEEADKYEKEYLKAVKELKKEFRKDKNLWDRFLDVLAGGTHQSPSERVMMQRWVDGEKEDEL